MLKNCYKKHGYVVLCGLDWVDPLPPNLCTDWQVWFSELPTLQQLRVKRCLSDGQKIVRSLSLHACTDASEIAYGAVIYARHEYNDGSVDLSLIVSKSRLVPLKAVSIPRLELFGAIIGLKLSKSVCRAIDNDIKHVTFWCDSMNVLYWVTNQSRRYKPFVAHRIGEIQDATNPNQWRHIPGKQNPADKLTRGLKVTELVTDTIWWHGPDFLK